MTADTPREPVTEAGRPMTTPALQAKVTLRGVWLAAHPNQPIPEGRAQVEALFAAIEADARGFAGHRTDDEHDCFLMNCRGLGREVASLREEARAAGLREAPQYREALQRLDTSECCCRVCNCPAHQNARALLAAPGAALAEGRALDVAWARCEAALPEGWGIEICPNTAQAPVRNGPWFARLIRDMPSIGRSPRTGYGPTPTAALEALADALAAPAEPATEGERERA